MKYIAYETYKTDCKMDMCMCCCRMSEFRIGMAGASDVFSVRPDMMRC